MKKEYQGMKAGAIMQVEGGLFIKVQKEKVKAKG